jgi:tRNA dimethylallyltransferase
VRAVEVCLLTGLPMSAVFKAGRKHLEGYAPIKIGLQPPRAALYQRIDARVHAMLQRGWREEVVSLQQGVPLSAKPFEFIGYRELCAHLDESGSSDTVAQEIAQATRHYAKRQLTWFRKESDVHWVPGFGDDPEIISAVIAKLERTLPEHFVAPEPMKETERE